MLLSTAGSRGRPAIQITRDQIVFLMKQGHTVKRMARCISVQEVQAASRVYHVPCPNSLWHTDGNMRLIRLV